MRKYLAVLSCEAGYGERLSRALSAKESLQLCPRAFSSSEELLRFAKEHPVALVLAEENFVSEGNLAGLCGHPAVLVLLREKESAGLPGCIFMYQGVEEIIRRISECLPETSLAGLVGGPNRSLRLVAVYSPSLPSLKTAFALTLAAMDKRERKTLYLNLEEFGGMSALLKGSGEKNLSDAVYFLKQDSLDQGKLRSMIRTGGSVDYIPPMPFAEDVREAGGEEWVRLIEKIAELTDYEEIVCDLPQSLYVSQDVIDASDELFLPAGGDGISQARMEELSAFMDRPEHQKLKDRVKKIPVPGDLLPEVTKDGDYAEELLYGKFGEKVLREVEDGRQ